MRYYIISTPLAVFTFNENKDIEHSIWYKGSEENMLEAFNTSKSAQLSRYESEMIKHITEKNKNAEIIFENMKDILAAAGATFDDVVKTVDYIVPEALPNYKGTADVRREYFKDNLPAATGVVVNRLLKNEYLIEIDAIAYDPDE